MYGHRKIFRQSLPNTIYIPLNQLPQRPGEIKKMKRPIVAYCHSDNRSGMTVSILKQIGLTDVFNSGGLSKLLQQKK
jgi:phage shock protein E